MALTREWSSGYENSPNDATDFVSVLGNHTRMTRLDVRERMVQGGHVWGNVNTDLDGRHAVGVGGGPDVYNSDLTTKLVTYANNITTFRNAIGVMAVDGSTSPEIRLRTSAGVRRGLLYWSISGDDVRLSRYDAAGSVVEGQLVLKATQVLYNTSKVWTNADNMEGVWGVARGGTGLSSLTTGNYIRASGAASFEQRTPTQVRGDIGAAAAAHTHNADDVNAGTLHVDRIPSLSTTKITSGTFDVARGGTGIASYTTGNYIRAASAGALEQRTPAQVRGDISAAEASHTHTVPGVIMLLFAGGATGRARGVIFVNNTGGALALVSAQAGCAGAPSANATIDVHRLASSFTHGQPPGEEGTTIFTSTKLTISSGAFKSSVNTGLAITSLGNGEALVVDIDASNPTDCWVAVRVSRSV